MGNSNRWRADMLVLDTGTPGLLGVPPSHTLDALVFATNTSAIRDVYVAGNHVVRNGQHTCVASIADKFQGVMQTLWAGA